MRDATAWDNLDECGDWSQISFPSLKECRRKIARISLLNNPLHSDWTRSDRELSLQGYAEQVVDYFWLIFIRKGAGNDQLSSRQEPKKLNADSVREGDRSGAGSVGSRALQKMHSGFYFLIYFIQE